MSQIVTNILQHYKAENYGTQTKLYQMLMHGKLAGSGKLIILPVDQGFEHGPIKSFSPNPRSYNPEYHFQLAIDAGLSAYAAPLGLLESGVEKYIGKIPLILKLNSANSLTPKSLAPDQAWTASIMDAIRLGCSAVGLTIYPGSAKANDMIEEAKEIIREAKSYGLAVVVWSYPRGENLSKEGETAIDVCAYAAHIAALIGANIIKVKLPTQFIEYSDNQDCYQKYQIPISSLKERVAHIMQSSFNSKRLVVFSGGASKTTQDILNEVHAINDGGGSGSIIGRNTFQRTYDDALTLLNDVCNIYLKKR